MRRSAAAVPRPAVHRAAYCLPARRCIARPPAVEECADAPTRPAGCPGSHKPGGATRGARCGGPLAVAAYGGARKVVVRARRTQAGVHGPLDATRRRQRGQPDAKEGVELRLVMPCHPQVHASLRCCGWNELLVCGGDTAGGRRPRCFTSRSCEGTMLLSAFLFAFNTLSGGCRRE